MSSDQLLYSSYLAPAVEARERTAARRGKAEGVAQGKAEGVAQGKAEGVAQGKAEAVLSILERRLGSLPAALRGGVLGLGAVDLDALLAAALDVPDVASLSDLVAARRRAF